MEKLIKYIYCISIICFALPSGDILGIPVKLIVTLCLLCLFLVSRMKDNKPIVFDVEILGFVVLIPPLLLWACLGVANNYETVFLCLKSFLALWLVVLCSYLMITNKIISKHDAMKVLCFTAAFMVGFKFFCELMLVTGVVGWEEFMDLYVYITGTSVTTMEMPLGGIVLYRIMTTNDFLPLVLVGFYFLYEKKSVWTKMIVMVVLAVYTFIVYSRVAMLQYGVVVLFYFASLCWDFLKKRTRKQMFIVTAGATFVSAAAGVVFWLKREMIIAYVTSFLDSMYERWFGNSASYSDSFRTEQKEYLWQGIWESPIWGHGLGSYVREYLRSTELPFSYEAEYLSFVYQLGFLGFILIIGVILILYGRICFKNAKRKRMKLLVLLNFGIWAVRPLYNPQFLSSSSGMIIVAIFLACSYYSQTIESKVEYYEK